VAAQPQQEEVPKELEVVIDETKDWST